MRKAEGGRGKAAASRFFRLCGWTAVVAIGSWVTCGDASAVDANLQWRRWSRPSADAGDSLKSSRADNVDKMVRAAAYDDRARGPELGNNYSSSRSEMRSIVVSRRQPAAPVRSAQLPFEDSSRSRLEESFREPLDSPPADDMPAAGDEQSGFNTIDVEEDFPFDAPQSPSNAPRTGRDGLPLDMEPPPREVGPIGSGPIQPDPYSLPELDQERADAQEICSEELTALRSNTLYDLNLSITVSGIEGEDYPFECSIDDGTSHPGRCWPGLTYMWKASALCHKPLYFENEQLERYGHSWGHCCQPFVSAAHFFSTLPVLPYCMGVDPPCECVYALGYYRPGNCAPYMCNPIPLSPRGALYEAGAVVGAAAWIP